MEALKIRMQALLRKIDRLSLRERVLVVIVSLGTVLGLWDMAFYQSIAAQRKQLTHQLTQVQTDIAAQTESAEQIRRKDLFDPNTSTRNQLASMRTQIDQTKAGIDAKAGEFISPRQMARALEELLSQHREMALINLKTLPPTKLFDGRENDEQDLDKDTLQDLPVVYRHGLSLEIEGRYFDTLKYLKALEALSWRFYWDAVDYQVKDYPLARVKIDVYTLSLEEGWLGV